MKYGYPDIILDLTRGKHPGNPSKTATAKVKNVLPAPEHCHYCNNRVEVVTHYDIYGSLYGNWPFAYRCTCCKAYVGMHPFTSIPLGTLANDLLRKARKECKPYFNKLWQEGFMSRSGAYEWLAGQLNIPRAECHFGWFNISQCETAANLCKVHYAYLHEEASYYRRKRGLI